MFTGIVEEIGIIRSIQKGHHFAALEIQAALVLADLKSGDSMAVNGICLTVTSLSSCGFTADVMQETLKRSTLMKLKQGSRVNLERAVPANGRFGGHFVSGHVDGTGTITKISRDNIAIWYSIQAAPSILRYIVEKGSIAIDGISLTVAKVSGNTFSISAIPHTVKITVLGDRRAGECVNLETDIVGKYVESLWSHTQLEQKNSTITKEFLSGHGYGGGLTYDGI